ncbi:MAG TPA: EAL domain-containing protein [Steroidobacteraceae bacterium]|jgi:diguanylate cyclase (GGDEF)-like protein|nr:EAL domain-containing protein [Steroidobacteraceae bacterium]
MPPEPPRDAAPIRILMVEDSQIDADLEFNTLTRSGVRHVAARVQTEQELRAALFGPKPDIILSDFSLPQFDGLSALRVARELSPAVPFIFVSGQMGEERAIEALHSGAVDYVLKSNLARLGPAVRRAVDEAAVRRRHETQIARLDRVLRMLGGVSGAAVRIRDRTELLRESCRVAVSIGGYAAAVAVLKVGGNPVVQPVAWCSGDDALAEALRAICAQSAARADSLIGRALKSGKAVVCNDTGELEATATFNSLMVQAGLRSVVALPILIDDTAVGALLLTTGEPGLVGDEELQMLREIAGTLSFALQYLQRDTTVRFLSHFDPQTGLAKRSLLRDRLAKLMLEPAARRSRHALAVFDIERLGLINDSFGRRTGDLLLQHVAARLKRHCPQTDRLAHLGGGTFALTWEPAAGPAPAPDPGAAHELLAESQAHAAAVFGEPFAVEQRDIPVAVRCGVALYPQQAEDAETLLQHAEAALLHARTGAERQLVYSAERHSDRIGKLAVEHKLRAALERREFELHYQPKVNVITRRIQGVEALIRWRDPAGGLIAPGAFLPVLESAGLGAAVGAWVIEQAAHDCQQWLRAGLPPVRVAVNLSSAQLQQPDFTARFLAAVQPWATSAWGLDIEVTEGALQEERADEMQRLNLLRRSGVRIAIDDFGTGYSSLRRLSALPVDTLKIDGCFISQIPGDVAGKAVVKTIITLARAFNMTTVAEGVEQQEQLDFLWQVGCDQSQGYLHSKPITCDQFALLLEHGNGNLILPAQPAEAAEDPDAERVG